VPQTILTDLQPGQLSPLAYLLQRINDPNVSAEVRDALAIACLPFAHPRAGYGVGKKQAALAAAKLAGGEWGDDLSWRQ
jgi:hypothetical protein